MNRKQVASAFFLISMLYGCSSGNNNASSSTSSTASSATSSVTTTEQASSETASVLPESEEPVSEHEYTVSEVLNDPAPLIESGQEITVVGYFPQAANVDDEGNYYAVILNSTDSNTENDRIRLATAPDFGGCKARVTGTLYHNVAGELELSVTSAEEIPE